MNTVLDSLTAQIHLCNFITVVHLSYLSPAALHKSLSQI